MQNELGCLTNYWQKYQVEYSTASSIESVLLQPGDVIKAAWLTERLEIRKINGDLKPVFNTPNMTMTLLPIETDKYNVSVGSNLTMCAAANASTTGYNRITVTSSLYVSGDRLMGNWYTVSVSDGDISAGSGPHGFVADKNGNFYYVPDSSSWYFHSGMPCVDGYVIDTVLVAVGEKTVYDLSLTESRSEISLANFKNVKERGYFLIRTSVPTNCFQSLALASSYFITANDNTTLCYRSLGLPNFNVDTNLLTWPTSGTGCYPATATLLTTVSSTSASAYPTDGPQDNFYYRRYFPQNSGTSYSGTLTDADFIGGINYNYNVNPDTDILVGQCISAEINFKTYNSSVALNQVYYYKVKMTEESTFKNVGVFVVTEITKTNNLYNIVAYDFLSKFDTDIYEWILQYNGATNSDTIANIFANLCIKIGVTGDIGDHYNSTASIYFNIPDVSTKISARAILGYLAALGGCVALSNSTGQIYFKRYGSVSSSTLDNTKYTSFSYSAYTVPLIDKVHIAEYEDSEGYDAGTGNNPLTIVGNKAFNSVVSGGLQTITNRIYTVVSSIPTYTPAEISTYKDFDIDVCDVITVDNKTVVVMHKMWNALGVTFICTGNEYRELLDIKKALNEDTVTDLLLDSVDVLDYQVLDMGDTVDNLSDIIDNLVDSEGYVSLNKLKGGNLDIGGYLNQYGRIRAYNASDTNIGYWDNNGLTIDDVTINLSLYSGQTLTLYLSTLSVEARFG